MVLINDPIFSREAITAYIGTQGKSDDRRNNSKKYGSFATNISHHQPEAQDTCILCIHKHVLDNYENTFPARKTLCYGCHKPIQMSINKYSRFVKRNILLAYMVTLQSRKL